MVYPSLYCNFEGFKVDIETRNKLRAEALATQTKALGRIQTMAASKDFNPGSPKQVAILVYDIFGATDPKIGWKKDPKTKKKTKKERGTDEKNLRAVGEQHPILLRLTDAIISYREQQKAIGTYFDFSLKNGRLLWALNPFGTDTNRMACTSSSFWCGTQVQNIPPYAKGMLTADEGFELMEADQSQSDARGTAYLSQDTALMSALETPGRDFYTSLGTLFFGIHYDKVSKAIRNAVLKKIVHGTNFMMGAATFVENAGVANLMVGAEVLGVKVILSSKPKPGELSIKGFAETLLESYHKPFYRVRMWYAEVKAEIRNTHLLKSPTAIHATSSVI
jgi:DNA polymerase I-like protein with 3'-5' exonuclease and polymerase domains